MASHRKVIKEELEGIRKKKGTLLPKDVIDFARKNKKSALHTQFEWDDSTAAEEYRLYQARNIIRVNVTIIKSDDGDRAVRVNSYVSLPDRRGIGYESIVDVMDDEDRSRLLLIETIHRLQQVTEVGLFSELNGVREAIERAASLYLPKPAKKGEKSSKRKTRVTAELIAHP